MRCVCEYDPIADVQAVDQFGFVDLVKANATSSIPSSLNAVELQYNEIDDPNSIAGRPSDDFEAMQMAKSIAGYHAPEPSSSSSESTE